MNMASSPTRLLLTLAYRNVCRNPRRSVLTLGAIIVGLASCLMLSLLARGISQGLLDDTVRNLTGHIQLHRPEFLRDPVIEQSFAAENIGSYFRGEFATGIKHWTARVRVPAVLMSERESYPITFLGVDPGAEGKLSFFGDGVSLGRSLESPGDPGVIIGKKLLQLLQTQVGKRVVIMSQGTDREINDQGFRIVGVFDAELDATERAFVFTGIRTAQKMLNMGAQVSEIALLVSDTHTIEALLKNLSHEFAELQVLPWYEIEPLARTLRQIQDKFLVFWFGIVVVAISIGLTNTLFMALFERVREIGLVQALGMRPWQIVIEVLCESLILLVVGMLLANASALLLFAFVKNGIDLSIFAQGTGFIGIRSVVIPQLLPADWIKANLLVLAVGMISSFYPAWKGSRLVPAHAMTRG